MLTGARGQKVAQRPGRAVEQSVKCDGKVNTLVQDILRDKRKRDRDSSAGNGTGLDR